MFTEKHISGCFVFLAAVTETTWPPNPETVAISLQKQFSETCYKIKQLKDNQNSVGLKCDGGLGFILILSKEITCCAE